MAMDFGDTSKGSPLKFNLKKKDQELHNLRVELIFDESPYENDEFDADLNLAVLERNGDKTITLPNGEKTPKMKFYAESTKSLIFFKNLSSLNNEIVHGPDVRNGGMEYADINLDSFPKDAEEITVFGTIYEGFKRKQNWKAMNAQIRLVNKDTGKVIEEYHLGENFGDHDGIHFGSLFRDEFGEWEFIPHGIGYTNMGLGDFIEFWQP